jgi:hypothetical protein
MLLTRPPHRVAVTAAAALPVLLMLAVLVYLVALRVTDDGQKMAFPGRGRPDDRYLEF